MSFSADVVYLNAEAGNSGVPIVNGDERWELISPVGSTVDGPTIVGSKNKAYQRTNAGNAGDSSNWSEGGTSEATPGATSLPTTGDFGLTWDEPAYRYSQQMSAQWWERLARARGLDPEVPKHIRKVTLTR